MRNPLNRRLAKLEGQARETDTSTPNIRVIFLDEGDREPELEPGLQTIVVRFVSSKRESAS